MSLNSHNIFETGNNDSRLNQRQKNRLQLPPIDVKGDIKKSLTNNTELLDRHQNQKTNKNINFSKSSALQPEQSQSTFSSFDPDTEKSEDKECSDEEADHHPEEECNGENEDAFAED